MITDNFKDTEYERAYNVEMQEWHRIYKELNLSQISKISLIRQVYFVSELAVLRFNEIANCWHLSLLESFDESIDFTFNVRDDEQRATIDNILSGVMLDNLLDIDKSSARIRLKGGVYEFTIKFSGGVELNYPINLEKPISDILFKEYPRVEKTRYTFAYQSTKAEADIYIYPIRDPRLEFEFKTQELCDSFVLKGIASKDVTGVKGQSNKETALKAYYEEK